VIFGHAIFVKLGNPDVAWSVWKSYCDMSEPCLDIIALQDGVLCELMMRVGLLL